MNRIAVMSMSVLIVSAFLAVLCLGQVNIGKATPDDVGAMAILLFTFGCMFEICSRFVYFRCPRCGWHGSEDDK